ncbi:nucleoredoxin-like protein 2 [Hydra vulgaris]|uniref:nucleoredoxin-like protein 2 n=1 Tax=Hydra vulgaris TaxID=6087 RepID=UPI001F5E7EA2|nr:nucleoredoxin-like protein 2 [Hydra vulgaris]
MEFVSGVTLYKADGSSGLADSILSEKDFVLYYFSAHWCHPCRQFTPVLKDFYEVVKDSGLEIIFMSSDESQEDMINYMKESHGDWYCVEYGSALVDELKQKFEVNGIPTLVVCRKDGSVINADANDDVCDKEPSALFAEWKNQK